MSETGKLQMGDIETQTVCYEDGTVAHRRHPNYHQPQFSFEQLKELVRRWNAFEDGGIVDKLVESCEGLVHRAECIIQSHQCTAHKGGNCCDLTYMLDAIQKGKRILAKATPE